jgi:hypothetical protein
MHLILFSDRLDALLKGCDALLQKYEALCGGQSKPDPNDNKVELLPGTNVWIDKGKLRRIVFANQTAPIMARYICIHRMHIGILPLI